MSKDTVRSLTKKGWSQKKIALKLRLRKTKVVAEQRRLKIGKRTKGGAVEFWRDVKSYKKLSGDTRKESIQRVKHFPKWKKKRVAKLTAAEQQFVAFWEEKDREYRASEWYKSRGHPEGMSKRLEESYEDYWETPE